MRFILMVLGGLALAVSVESQPVSLTVSRFFTNRAVLQRDQNVPVWGTVAPGVTVTVSFADQRVTAVADAGGAWLVRLAPLSAESEGRDLVIETSDGQDKTLTDVVVGDLWYCAGQSNMELGMAAIANRGQEVKDLKYPALRLYLIPKSASGAPRAEVFGVWVPSDRPSVTTGGWNGFSAVAYTFGRRLQKELGVPVGVIQAAYGGSPIAAWIPGSAFAADPDYAGYAEQIRRADQGATPQSRHPFDDPSDTKDLGPGSIWNAMVHPLGPLALKGVLWYQGETDVGDGPLYTKKLNTLIAAWRQGFHQPELPVYVAQIAPWQGYGGDSLPRLWAAQFAVLATPGTGVALTVDLGDFGDIHPANKRPVGERLALQALVKTYGRTDLKADGPVFAGWKDQGSQVVVSWTGTGTLTTTAGQPPLGFEVLDAPGRWTPVSAVLSGAEVVLEAGEVRGVRYAWSATPLVNLTDASGLPARPFSTAR